MKLTRLAILFTVALMTSVASAQSDTAFTYQGELKQNGTPANGLFDIEFALWDAVSAGNQIDSTIEHREVPVVEGKFTDELDFGANAFDNNDRWLEITVDGNTLSPRTPITRAPYSIQTRGIFVNDAGDVGIGTTTPEYPLEVHNSGTTGQILRLASDQTYGYVDFREGSTTRALLGFGDPGDLLDNANTNSFAINGLSSAIHLAVDNDANKGITIYPNGDVGIGTTIPEYPLHVDSGSLGAAIYANANRPDGVTHGVYGTCKSEHGTAVRGMASALNGYSKSVWGTNLSSDGFGVYGEASSVSGVNYGVFGHSNSSAGYGVYGVAASSGGVNYGVCGVSLSSSGYDFYAGGAGQDFGSSSSRRWKSNIVAIDQPLDKISQLQGVYFDWDKDHGGHHDVGMIAEDVGAVLPEIVQYEDNGVDAHGMDYSKLTPLLVESVKALHDENESLRSRLVSLEQHNHEIQQQIQNLQRLMEPASSSSGEKQ